MHPIPTLLATALSLCHTVTGFNKNDSAVTVFAMSGGPTLILDETATKSDELASTLGNATTNILNAKAYEFTNCLMVVSPEHSDVFKRDNYSKAQLRNGMQQASEKTTKELAGGPGSTPDELARLAKDFPDRRLRKFAADEDIDIVVAGSEAGKCAGLFHGWLPHSIGSIPVSRRIEA